ncbi:hypothetical protein B7494_g769 [Chlorociboria aeruginascens]|nr:hypothetical protein B7494_g769 [Chlorociboria aeruginascens]
MALVDYPDSDESGSEAPAVPQSATISSKPTFHKVVDRSNPGKIRVSLPQATLKGDVKIEDSPPTKRIKTGGNGLSGFNSFLPAPKRTGQSTNTTLGGGSTARKGGLGVGVNLKTGAAPGFSREPELLGEYEDDSNAESEEPTSNSGTVLNALSPNTPQDVVQKPATEVKLAGKPTMFKPLSVSRKPVKQKQVPRSTPLKASTPVTPSTPQSTNTSAPKPKISLFSISAQTSSPAVQTSDGEYQPVIYDISNDADDNSGSILDLEPTYEEYTPTTGRYPPPPPAVPTPPISQSLSDIAGDLHLSAAERRQLFGRQKGNRNGSIPSATKIINFNTDKEYRHNEELRAAGEQVVHNPVRSIAPGKHNLKQLVNSAQSQKDAFEESFAKGKSNRAEASSRYGW